VDERAVYGPSKMKVQALNNCVQVTPDCAFLFIVAQVSGAPDAERSAIL
jgi:hypothetical protein